MGKSTISMAIFNCYVCSPEGILIVIILVFEFSQKNYFLWAHHLRDTFIFYSMTLADLWSAALRDCAKNARLVYMDPAAFAAWTVEPISSVRDVLSLVGCSQDVWESCVEWIVSGTACTRLPEKTREWALSHHRMQERDAASIACDKCGSVYER